MAYPRDLPARCCAVTTNGGQCRLHAVDFYHKMPFCARHLTQADKRYELVVYTGKGYQKTAKRLSTHRQYYGY